MGNSIVLTLMQTNLYASCSCYLPFSHHRNALALMKFEGHTHAIIVLGRLSVASNTHCIFLLFGLSFFASSIA